MSQNRPESSLSRRCFLQHGGVLAGGAILGAAPSSAAAERSPPATISSQSSVGELPRRVLGKTGESLTILTLGTAPCGFARPASPKNVAACVNAALDAGINSVDTAPAYDVAEEGVGLGLGRRRKQVFLATKVMADTIDAAEKSLARSLKLLKTDYVDLVYFHHIGDRQVDAAVKPEGVYTWLLKQKKAGKTRFVGVSGHNRPGRFARFLDSGDCDVLLTVVNFVDRHTYHFERDVLPIAQKNKVGVVAMKVLGGSLKGNYAQPDCPPHLDARHLRLALRYALAVPGVTTLNIGVHNVDQIRTNVELAMNLRPLTDQEQADCDKLGRELAAAWGEHFGPRAEASPG